MTTPRVVLQPKRARPFFGRHPWLFSGAVERLEGEPADGSVVDVVTHTGQFVARGLYNGQSRLCVRLYSWDQDRDLDAGFFRDRIEAALRLRQALGLMSPGQGCRLVNSEGDGLSGVTVDRYDRWLVLQFTSLALAQRRDLLADILTELLQPEGIYLRTERGIGQLEGLVLHDGPFRGGTPPAGLTIEENGLRFRINLAEGQKTGFYLDQRDNREGAARLAPGRRVLDAFCYSGGFGLYALRAGATEVLGVDQSEAALELARANAAENGLAERARYERGDVFRFLEELAGRGERFGMVVLDPPKFARTRKAVDEALRGYRRIQALALQVIEPEGFLVSCCCSGVITPAMLEELLAQLAAEARREVQILQRRGPSPDHPVSVSCLESHYLKCLIARVR
jgi:23S rRNA (cytosine1962-C5)-methyltransferase